MKNKISEYVGLTKEEKDYLREFDKALQLGYFKDDLVSIPDDIKQDMVEERNKFRSDIMYKYKRKGDKVDHMVLERKLHIGKKRVKTKRDKAGRFTRKETE